jgi:hypothetical protein
MRGFSLIEALIATSLLVVVALGVAPLVAMSAKNTMGARLTLDALAAGTERMEQLAADPFSIGDAPSGALAADCDGWFDEVPAGSARLTRRWYVGPAPLDPANARIVAVDVFGPGANARVPLASFRTLRTRSAP